MISLGRTLGKENGSAPAERLGVDPMLRNKRKDILQQGLFPAIIRDGSFHDD